MWGECDVERVYSLVMISEGEGFLVISALTLTVECCFPISFDCLLREGVAVFCWSGLLVCFVSLSGVSACVASMFLSSLSFTTGEGGSNS